MSTILRKTIRQILLEVDTSASAFENFGSSKISSDRKVAEIKIDNVPDLEGAHKVLSLVRGDSTPGSFQFPDPKQTSFIDKGVALGMPGLNTRAQEIESDRNTEELSNTGWAVLGVTRYSPIEDFVPELFVTKDMTQMVEKYKAFGHCFVLFIDENGMSQRYEFGPSDDCPPLDQGKAVDKAIKFILADPGLIQKAYAVLSDAIFRVAPIGIKAIMQVAGDPSPENKRRVLQAALPLIFETQIFGIVPDIIHLFVPGKVWGTSEAGVNPVTTPPTRFTTGKVIAVSLCPSGTKPVLNGDYYVCQYEITPKGSAEKRSVKVMVKNMLFNEYSVIADPGSGSSPLQAYAGVKCNNISGGVDYCKSILANKCKVPYAVPIPGVDFPSITGAINCALFAANAINAAGSSFTFNVKAGADYMVTPTYLFNQIKGSSAFSRGSPTKD